MTTATLPQTSGSNPSFVPDARLRLQVEMHTFHNVSHKGILSDADSLLRVVGIIHRYGGISNNSSALQQPSQGNNRRRGSATRKGFSSFLQFAGEPFRRWNFTEPRADSS